MFREEAGLFCLLDHFAKPFNRRFMNTEHRFFLFVVGEDRLFFNRGDAALDFFDHLRRDLLAKDAFAGHLDVDRTGMRKERSAEFRVAGFERDSQRDPTGFGDLDAVTKIGEVIAALARGFDAVNDAPIVN